MDSIEKANSVGKAHDEELSGGGLPAGKNEQRRLELEARLAAQVKALDARYRFAMYGGKACVVDTELGGELEGEDPVLRPNEFKSKYQNRFASVLDAKSERQILVANAWLSSPTRSTYEALVFRPDREPHQTRLDGKLVLNQWRGFAFDPSSTGSWEKLRTHWLVNICQRNVEHYLYQFAWFAQQFRRRVADGKPGINLVLRGVRGTGKTLLIQAIGRLLGPHFLKANKPEHITGRFNAHLATCLLLYCNEALWAGSRSDESALKNLITGEDFLVERKNFTPHMAKNYIWVVTDSNSDWVVPAALEHERRFAVFDVPENDHIGDTAYWLAIKEQLDDGGYARLLYDLLNLKTLKINEQHVEIDAIDLRKVPQTQALAEQRAHTLSPVLAFLAHIADVGEIRSPTQRAFLTQSGLRISKADFRDAFADFCTSQRLHLPSPDTVGRLLKSALKIPHHDPGGRCAGPAFLVGRTEYSLPPIDVVRARLDLKLGREREAEDNELDETV